MTDKDTFYTVKEFAERIKVHPSTVLKGIKSGRFQAFKIGQGARSDYRICASEERRLCELDMSKLIKSIVDTEINNRLEKNS
jgi:hypothetical protein